MTREDVEQQSHVALGALALRLQKQVRERDARIAALEADRNRPGDPPAPPKTSENASVPPAKGWKRSLRPPPSGGQRGPKPGHLGVSRRRAEPAHVRVCRPTTCACGADLTGVAQRRVGQHQLTELPPLRVVVLEAQRYAATCPSCGTTTTAPAPDGFARGRVFGPRLAAVVTSLHQQHHVSYQRLPHLTETLFGLHLSQGARAHHPRQVAVRLRPQVEAIKQQGRGSPVIGSDETGARVDGRTHWQWVVPNTGGQLPHDPAHSGRGGPTRGAG